MNRPLALVLPMSAAALVAACAAPPPALTDAGFVHWIGLDSRPLAVGSQLILNFVISTDAGAQLPSDDAGTESTYIVGSSNPDVVSVTDLGQERVQLSILAAGSATLAVQTAMGVDQLRVAAAVPVALTLADSDHLGAGIDVFTHQTFDLLTSSQEVLQGVVLDALGRPLNSWGLVAAPLLSGVTKREPEQLVLVAPPAASRLRLVASLVDAGAGAVDAGEQADGGAEGDGGAVFADAGGTVDAGPNAVYDVVFVSTAASVRLISDDDPLNPTIIAQAFAADGRTEVFGIDDWQFACQAPPGAASCIMNRLAVSVVHLQNPNSALDAGASYLVTVRSPSRALTGSLSVK